MADSRLHYDNSCIGVSINSLCCVQHWVIVLCIIRWLCVRACWTDSVMTVGQAVHMQMVWTRSA